MTFVPSLDELQRRFAEAVTDTAARARLARELFPNARRGRPRRDRRRRAQTTRSVRGEPYSAVATLNVALVAVVVPVVAGSSATIR